VSFVDDIAAAVDALGVKAAGIVYGIALTPWESDQQRDEFLSYITGGGNEQPPR
jgi:nucleoid-associated protein YejK